MLDFNFAQIGQNKGRLSETTVLTYYTYRYSGTQYVIEAYMGAHTGSGTSANWTEDK